MSISSVQDKVVIITGCSSGIGLATARLFLERKAIVFGIDIGSIPQVLAEEFSTFTFYQTDLTQSQASEIAVAKCIGKYNRVDVLVNCAGVSDGWSSADTLQDEEWEKVIAINLTVPIRLMKAVLPAMKEQKGGSIVNVSSKAGMSGASAGIAYTASKHGLVSLITFEVDVTDTDEYDLGWCYEEHCMEVPRGQHQVQCRTPRWCCNQHCLVSFNGLLRLCWLQFFLVSRTQVATIFFRPDMANERQPYCPIARLQRQGW